MVFAAVGAVAGALTHVGASEANSPAPPAPPPSNVVALSSEKLITLARRDIPLSALMAEISRQTDRRYTLDKRFQDDAAVYSFQLGAVPVSRVRAAVAYMVRGVWEQRGLDFHLRPKTAHELAQDARTLGSLGERLYPYLLAIDPNDEGLTPAQASALRILHVRPSRAMGDLDEVVWDDPNRWSLLAGPGGVEVTYTPGTPGTPPITRGLGVGTQRIISIGGGKPL
jgi:hypothetical protein